MNGPPNDNGQQDENGQPPNIIPMEQFQLAMFNFITSSNVYQENTSAILNNLVSRMENVESKLENVESKLENVETRLQNVETGNNEIKEALKSFGNAIQQVKSLEEVKEEGRNLTQQLSTQNQ